MAPRLADKRPASWPHCAQLTPQMSTGWTPRPQAVHPEYLWGHRAPPACPQWPRSPRLECGAVSPPQAPPHHLFTNSWKSGLNTPLGSLGGGWGGQAGVTGVAAATLVTPSLCWAPPVQLLNTIKWAGGQRAGGDARGPGRALPGRVAPGLPGRSFAGGARVTARNSGSPVTGYTPPRPRQSQAARRAPRPWRCSPTHDLGPFRTPAWIFVPLSAARPFE